MIIWIASYPRSGNTFLRVILKSVFELETYSIYDDKSAIAKDAATSEVVGHKMLPDDFDLDEARISERLYLIKTHDVIPPSVDKAIYLVRDGRQSALSYVRYINSFIGVDCAISDVLYGDVPFGSWGESVKSWNPKQRQNTLLVKFEELIVAPHSFLDQISEFIGIEKQSDQIPGFESLHKINPNFFRQGKSDSWKDELTQDEINIFWMNNYSQMRQYYPEEICPELLQDANNAPQFSKLFRDQGSYFKVIVSDLRQQVQETDRRATILENKVVKLEENLDRLESELHDKSNKLVSIRSAIAQMIDVKAWKSPLNKYRAYKKLLDIYCINDE